MSINYKSFFSDFTNQLDNYMDNIPIVDLLSIDDYYRTDLHWRQERISDVAKRLLNGMNATVSQQKYNEIELSPFYGAYFGQAALPISPDIMVYLNNSTLMKCTVFNPLKKEYSLLYSADDFENVDSYDLFLSGAQALLVLNNPQNTSARELYIVRDSFASSLAPLLIESYSKIILIDIRYVSAQKAKQYISPSKSCDILFLLNTMTINRPELYK